MIANLFAHRVLLKAACALLLPLGLAWHWTQALRIPATLAHPGAAFELPVQWDGRPLRPLALGEVEQRFARRFPGHLARLTDGRQTLVLRSADRPTRMLHPAADCYQGLGWQVQAQRLEHDGQRRLWRCFEAGRDGRRLKVCERIEDAAGQGFTDSSSWYWAAMLGRSQGPWQAVTVAQPL